MTNLIAFCEELTASVDHGAGGKQALEDFFFYFSSASKKVSL